MAEQKNQDFFLTNQIKEVDKVQNELEILVEKQQLELVNKQSPLISKS